MNKDMILSIETSTGACSAALSKGKDVIGSICITEPKAHASKLAPMIDRLMKENGMEYGELAAVAVSEGPGSYTGLRVGVSTAKGICYGSGAKLIGINTLDILADINEPNPLPRIGDVKRYLICQRPHFIADFLIRQIIGR